MAKTVYLLLCIVGAAGCATRYAGEAVPAGSRQRFRDIEILQPQGSDRTLSEFPQPEMTDDGAPCYYVDHDFRYDAAMQDGDYRPFNEMGRRYGEGFSTRLSLRAAWRPYEWLYFGVVPEWYFGESLDNGSPDKETVFHEAFVRMTAGNFWIDWGRFPMWWGPGAHGSLLLSSNYRTRDTVRISTAEPVVAKGWLAGLGLLRFTAFASDLTEGTTDAGRYLGGMRLSFKPSPKLECSLSRTFVLPKAGGDVDGGMLSDVLFFRPDDTGADSADQKISFDARYTFGARAPTSIYAEIASEDEAGNKHGAVALLAGTACYLPWGEDWLRITIEWADTDVAGEGENWYSPLYYYRGDSIGHHAGTDSSDFYTEITWLDTCGTERIRFYVDREEHGVSAPVTEIMREKGLVISVDRAAPWVMEFRAAHQEKENAGGVGGANESATLISFAVRRDI